LCLYRTKNITLLRSLARKRNASRCIILANDLFAKKTRVRRRCRSSVPRSLAGVYTRVDSEVHQGKKAAGTEAPPKRQPRDQTLRKPQNEILFAPSTTAADARGGELAGDDIRRRSRRLLLLVPPAASYTRPRSRRAATVVSEGGLSLPPSSAYPLPPAPAAGAIEVSDSSHSRGS
jgi:hypothetical protein